MFRRMTHTSTRTEKNAQFRSYLILPLFHLNNNIFSHCLIFYTPVLSEGLNRVKPPYIYIPGYLLNS
jgi:hypothetical protein